MRANSQVEPPFAACIECILKPERAYRGIDPDSSPIAVAVSWLPTCPCGVA